MQQAMIYYTTVMVKLQRNIAPLCLHRRLINRQQSQLCKIDMLYYKKTIQHNVQASHSQWRLPWLYLLWRKKMRFLMLWYLEGYSCRRRVPWNFILLTSRWSSFPLKPTNHRGPWIRSTGWMLPSPKMSEKMHATISDLLWHGFAEHLANHTWLILHKKRTA